jgi:hypothetical protein
MRIDPKTQLPQRVNISGLLYEVKKVKDLKNQKNEALDGEISYSREVINLNPDLLAQMRWQVFIHELVHGWVTTAHIALEDEENTVDILAYQIYNTLFSTDWNTK